MRYVYVGQFSSLTISSFFFFFSLPRDKQKKKEKKKERERDSQVFSFKKSDRIIDGYPFLTRFDREFNL